MNSNAGISMVFRENVIRFFHPFDHRGAVYLYVFAIFALMAPWSVFLPASLWRAHTNEPLSSRARNGDRFFLVSFWAIFIFFTLSGSRRSYYLLPILPFASVLVARLFTDEGELVPTARRLMMVGFVLLVASSALAPVALAIPPELRPGSLRKLPTTPAPIALLLLSIGAVALIAIAARFFRNQSRLKLGLMTAVIAYAGLVYIFIFVLPAVEPYRGEKPFAQAVRHELANEPGNLALYKIWGPGLVYYLANATPIPEYDDPKSISAADQKKPLYVIALQRDLASLPPGGAVRLSETTFAWEKAKERGSKYVLVRFP
jgi:4-amino-4-deoxy-L-arabinose transferase-like glycosyltransferase